MREIWGLVPAAGKATRLARGAVGESTRLARGAVGESTRLARGAVAESRRKRPSKEILPLLRPGAALPPDASPRIACQDLLESFRLAGVSRALVLLRQGKWDIPQR